MIFDDDDDPQGEPHGCFTVIIACLIFWAVIGTACSRFL